MISTGKFITLEGSEGVGKSTNAQFITEVLKAHNMPFVMTREPGGTPLSETIRSLLLQKNDEKIHASTELLLLFAARAQHLQNKILPALASGTWVVCDRFTDSTYAYQGGGRKFDKNFISQLENIVQQGKQPDLTFYLDIDVRLGLSRIKEREKDRIESETLSFFERVRASYLERAHQNPHRFQVIDASQPIDKVQHIIRTELESYFFSN